jgi:hypothetical protein
LRERIFSFVVRGCRGTPYVAWRNYPLGFRV